jgi:ferredoxin-NADP reductase
MSHTINIQSVTQVTHDVKCFRTSKPTGFHFVSGQATDLAINQPGFEEQVRPFTFTCLDSDKYLEFTIKRYADRHGITDRLHQLKTGDELLISDAWGAIEYKGPGYFIAGGAGITPFISILRKLHQEKQLAGNTLFFSNKTAADIIYGQEISNMLGERAVYVLTRENKPGYKSGHIDKSFIQQQVHDFKCHFYVCGPDKMVQDIVALLGETGAATDALVFEK